MASSASLIPSNVVQAIRDSCVAICDTSNICIRRSAIEYLLKSPAFTGTIDRLSKAHGLAFPLNFPSVKAELNLLSTLSILNFASGYRVPLHSSTGRGAWDNIRALVFGLYISSTPENDYLSAEGMKSITEQQIADFLRVELHVERPHESIPGVTIGELGGPLYELVQHITQTLHETGEAIINLGHPDLGSFVLEALKRGRTNNDETTVDVDIVLGHILRALPAFRDMTIINEQPVYIFKKALFMLHAINIRFSKRSTAEIPIPDTSTLPVFSDNVLPSILIYLGIIDLSSCAQDFPAVFKTPSVDVQAILEKQASSDSEVIAQLPPKPPEGGPVLSEEQAYVLRAAAINACDIIVDMAKSLGRDMTLPDIDMWLWAVAKDRRDLRELPRFVLRNTVMF